MIVRTSRRINPLNQRVFVNGVPDDRFTCVVTQLGSHCGLTEIDVVAPSLYFDEITQNLRDAFIRVSLDGSGDEHFCGYLATDSGVMSPDADEVTFQAYSFTRWLTKYHVGQFYTPKRWEVPYPVYNALGQPTGWTPALILQHLFSLLPENLGQRIGLGDLKVLNTLADIPTPTITFRLANYSAAIQQLVDLVGDVAFRERFENNRVFLDFYRVSDLTSTEVEVTCCRHENAGMANVQEITNHADSSEMETRVIGFGAYRQAMITCRNAVTGQDDISELEAARQLQPDWDAALEPIVLKSPQLATSPRGYSARNPAVISAGSTTFEITVELNMIPVGAMISTKTGEIMKVVSFTPKVTADPEADPPVTASPASVVVIRAQDGTTAAELPKDTILRITVPGIQQVFRRYKLPEVLRGLTIVKEGCLRDNQAKPFPMWQAFTYEAEIRQMEDEPEPPATVGKKWLDGTITTTPTQTRDLKFDANRYVITFAKPTLTLDYDRLDSKNKKEVVYQRTVCGVTFTIENPEVPFYHDTGAVEGVTNFDFDTIGLTTQWQKNEFQSWRVGSYDLPIRGLDWPCLYFSIIKTVDEENVVTEHEGKPHYYAPTTGFVSRSDYLALKSLAEQTLRERCRRSRRWSVRIPWFSPGYQPGQRIHIRGENDVPEDILRVTGVTHNTPLDGDHSTELTIDNSKPKVTHRVRARG